MNYRHAFHAGNFADVFKHAALTLILEALAVKDKPFAVIETHAGAGRYDLAGESAQKSAEWRDGIGRLWGERAPPAQLARYLELVRAANPAGAAQPRFYPGSPLIAHELLRADDRLVLCEIVLQEAEALARELGRDPRVMVRVQDGYAALKALLPPPERRGLVLIDPPYEKPQEFGQAIESLRAAHARWPTGIYALWYPQKEREPIGRMERTLIESGIRRVLRAELCVFPPDSAFRLNGSGMIVINPPWKLDESLRAAGDWLLARLRRVEGAVCRVGWLVPE